MNDNLSKRKILSALCHGSIFFSATVVSIGIPIAILVISDDEIIQGNAKEALNFHLNVWVYGIIFTILILVLIGWLLLGILGLVTLIMPIIGIFAALNNPNQIYRYPFILHVF
ncbi:MAG: DUF4870 domain-containing protein [Microcystaceae cyanobacterium]